MNKDNNSQWNKASTNADELATDSRQEQDPSSSSLIHTGEGNDVDKQSVRERQQNAQSRTSETDDYKDSESVIPSEEEFNSNK